MKRITTRLTPSSASIKALLIGILLLLLLIPLQMVRSVVRERAMMEDAAVSETMSMWGGEPVFAGPVLTVPYRVVTEDHDGRKFEEIRTAVFLPELLEIEGTMDPAPRKRGIYTVPLFTGDLRIRGTFRRPDFSKRLVAEEQILWDLAALSLSFPDLRAVREEPDLTLDGTALVLEPGRGDAGILPGEMSAPVAGLAGREAGSVLEFEGSLGIRGGASVRFIPLGGKTEVRLASDWGSPRFSGSFLPESRELEEERFTARWYVLALARNYPQSFLRGEIDSHTIEASSFGVDLMVPVDRYQKSTRSVKYGLLFLFIPFLVFFLFETLGGTRIHPLRYLLAGSANILFYLLLLSLSEHIPFGWAYLAASAASGGLLTLWASWTLRSARRGFVIAPVMTSMYLYLYTALSSEEYALLIGSVGLFVLLAAVMFLTRNVDWYRVGQREDSAEQRIT